MSNEIRAVLRAPTHRTIFGYWLETLREARLIHVIASKNLRDIYHQTLLGRLWLLLRALLPTLAIMMLFQFVDSFQHSDLPYPIYVLSGAILWIIVDIGLLRGTRSLSRVQRISHMVYFTKLTGIVGSLSVPLLYHIVFVGFAICVVAAYWLTGSNPGLELSERLVFLPLIFFSILLLLVGLLSFFAILFLLARDIRLVMPLIRQVWFIATPVFYPLTLLPEKWVFWLYVFNPMVGQLEAFRWAVFGVGELNVPMFAWSCFVSLIIFFIGSLFLMRADKVVREVV